MPAPRWLSLKPAALRMSRCTHHLVAPNSSSKIAADGPWPWAVQMFRRLCEADVLIGVSGGERTVSATQLEKLREDATHRLTVIDLALTHDFDPAIGDLPAVDLITLESVKMAAPTEQQASITQAQQLVDQAVDDYLTEKRERTG